MSQPNQVNRIRKAPRGVTLNITLAMTALIAVVIAGIMATAVSAVHTSGDMLTRRKAFYVCDGISRSVAKLAGDYLATVDVADDAQMKSYIEAAGGGAGLPDITPPGWSLEGNDFTVSASVGSTDPLPSGPYEGMIARQDDLSLSIRAVQDATGYRCGSVQKLSVGDIFLFQFFAFAEYGLDLGNCAPTTVTGRVHVNGEFCGGCWGNNGKINRVTASGAIHHVANCSRYTSGNSGNKIYFDNGNDSGVWKVMNSTNDATMGATWRDYAMNRWGGKVQDQAMGVQPLRVPFVSQPRMQDGFFTDKTVHDNSQSQRFFVDPVMDGDPQDVKDERLAYKADLRIIDGVWYKNDGTWPGMPIYSDHPGQKTTKRLPNNDYKVAGIEVGANQIGVARGWGAEPPHLYSYYETYWKTTDADYGRLVDDTQGVISYGGLVRKGTPPNTTWEPGFWLDDGELAPEDDPAPGTTVNRARLCSFGVDGDFKDVSGGLQMVSALGTECYACVGMGSFSGEAPPGSDCDTLQGKLVDTNRQVGLLAATRTGFDDPRVEQNSPSTPKSLQSAILPINFDLAAFTTAMQTTTDKELGSYFSGGADFNGIVWIGSTWDGQLSGLDTGAVTLWPYNVKEGGGTVALTGGNAPLANAEGHPKGGKSGYAQRALPYPLCSDSLGWDPTTGIGARHALSLPADHSSDGIYDPAFTIPRCDDTAAIYGETSRPNAVRIINANTLDHTVFPKGLSIGTNLPGYLLGSTNISSNTPANWVPMMFAADATTGMSNAWQDKNRPWTTDPNVSTRKARDTQWRVALFSGWVWPVGTASPATGLQNWLRFVEDWGSSTYECRIDGSLVMGFASVFQRQKWEYSPVFKACTRTFNFDTKLASPVNQPPGTPKFQVSATRSWRRF